MGVHTVSNKFLGERDRSEKFTDPAGRTKGYKSLLGTVVQKKTVCSNLV